MKYSPKNYASALFEALKESPSDKQKEIVQNFAARMARDGALGKAGEIFEKFSEIWRKENGVEKIEIATADGKLPEALAKIFGGKTEIILKSEPEILGGAKIKIGDTLIDNTVRGRISNLKKIFNS